MGHSFAPPPPLPLSTAGRMLGETELLDALQRGARQSFAFLDGQWGTIPPLWWYRFVHDDWPGRKRIRFNVNGLIVEATGIVVDQPPPIRMPWKRPPVTSADLVEAGWLSDEEALARDQRLAGLNAAVDTAISDTRTERAGQPHDANVRSRNRGRPSLGKGEIEGEFNRRDAAGEVGSVLADEARALLAWYEDKYPEAKSPSLKTIRNNLCTLNPGRWTPVG
jgi:hypothetical protein